MSKSKLEIQDVSVAVDGKEIISDISIGISSGEVHALMGPNGAGKSTLSNAIMGRAGYEVTTGQVLLDGRDILTLPTWERARAGLFLGMQYPIEVPGVTLNEMISAAGGSVEQIAVEAVAIGQSDDLVNRDLNVDLSGGEKKRSETIQLAVLTPKFALLDEPDSGLDVDSLETMGNKVSDLAKDTGLGVLVVTHYNRLLDVLKPDYVHVLVDGKIVKSGDADLAKELEASGYAEYLSS